MNKGISFYFGFESDPKTRMEKIKDAGFDCIITNADPKFNYQNGEISQQVRWMKKNNIKPSSLHMRYNSSELFDFWKEGEIGEKIVKNLIKDIKIASKYNFSCVVVHMKGEASELGISRLKRILKYAEKYNTPIAIENLKNKECFTYIFERINHPYLKFCFDIGHQNVFDSDYDFLNNHLDKLICLHLHSNNGQKDSHTINKYGNIDWDRFAKTLAKLNRDINLDYEILIRSGETESEQEILNIVYSQAKELEEKIKYYKSRR